MISHFIILFISAHLTSAGLLTSIELQDDKAMYPPKPTEILPIQPILIYPIGDRIPYQGRALFKDNELIYIKLLKRKHYRPKNVLSQTDRKLYPKDTKMDHIFYVKALANGQFSHNRLKLYRLPEFYAITIYKKQQFKK